MTIRQLLASTMLVGALAAAPLALMAADQLQTRDQLHAQTQAGDQSQTRDQLHTQAQAGDQLQTRDQSQARNRQLSQDQTVTPKKNRTQKRIRTH